MPPDEDPTPGRESIAVVEASVLMVRVSVTGPLPATRVMLEGTNVHEMWDGSVPQAKSTVPLKPPVGVMVIVKFPL